MPSSERSFVRACFAVVTLTLAPRAFAQTQAQGFSAERLYTSPAGAGWVVMDRLDMHGGLAGAMALTAGYANAPVKIASGADKLTLISDDAFVGFGFAATYDRFRLSLDLDAPLVISGPAGTVGGYAFTGPTVDLASTPDTFSDARVGLDARLLGAHDGPLRLGLGAQLYLPAGKRSDYDSDGTYRAMIRALLAGDVGPFTYAGHVGVHVRPLDDSPTPGSPQGSELLFGVAAGARVGLGEAKRYALIAGPEVFGETALGHAFASGATGVEGLVSARVEGTGEDGPQLRVKVAGGGGLDAQFGAPAWRVVFGLEVFGRPSTATATAPPSPPPIP